MRLSSCHEIAVFILKYEGEVLFQNRSANKKYYPNMWSLCTGHVEKGEDVGDAAIREIYEELGVMLG